MSEIETTAISTEVAAAAEQGQDLHAKVRDITLRALSKRSLSVSEIMDVVRAVTEGVTLGLGRRAGEVGGAVKSALSGLDEALQKTAEATKLAAQQMLAQGKDFGEQDLKPALDELKQLEENFLSTVSKVAESAGGRIKEEFKSQLDHARRNGTDSGRLVADTLREFSNRGGGAVKTGVMQTASAALEIKQRLTLIASGILAGMADTLHDKANSKK